MSVTGLCQICERPQAQHQCSHCGSLVCEDHYVIEDGLCTECAADLSGRSV